MSKKVVTWTAIILALAGTGWYLMEHVREYTEQITAFVRRNEAWMPHVVFVLSFLESLAIISLIAPASVILLGVAGLLGASGVSGSLVFTAWAAASAGATIGYGISYWIGRILEDRIHTIWPFTYWPDLIKRSEDFFRNWGGDLAVFVGHFFTQARWVIPVIAGSARMPHLRFQLANVTSAMFWAAWMVAVPVYGVKGLLGLW